MKQMEKEEFLEAYENYADAIFRYCLIRVYDREKARDLVQDVFIRAWNYIGGGRVIENWKPFLFRTATNLMIDASRKKHEQISLETLMETGFDAGLDARSHVDNYIDGQKAVAAINDLEEIYRLPVYMRYVEDMSPKDIAQITGESENVISVRIHRGIYMLKKLIE